MPSLTIYAEQHISPGAVDVIRAAKEEVLGDEPLSIEFIGPEDEPREGIPVLCLGSGGKGDVHTLSPKQLLVRGNAITALAASLRIVLDIPEPPVYTYRVISDISDLAMLGNVVMFDIEVGGDVRTDLPWETPIISMAFYDGETIMVVPEELCEAEETKRFLSQWFPKRTLVGHNLKFDCRTVGHRLGIKIKPSHDTMLMYFALNHNGGDKDLKTLCQRQFNAPEWEKDIAKYTKGGGHYERIPRPLLYGYNAGDVYWNGRLYAWLVDLLEQDPPRRALYKHILAVANMLQDIEDHGLDIDATYFEGLSDTLGGEAEAILTDLRDLVENEKFNPGSPQQVKRVLEVLGIETADTAEPTLEVVRRGLADDSMGGRFIDGLLDYRGKTKLKTTYADGILTRTREGRLYPQYLAHGTITGRLSSKNPNIQNMPRGPVIRTGLVIPEEKPDETFAECDYSQAELRTLAEITGDENMIAAFQPGAIDYFDNMMPNAFSSQFETVADYLVLKEAEAGTCEHDLAVELRAKLKGVQYGMNYGRQAAAIAVALNITRAESEALLAGIHATYPGLKEWQDKVRAAVTDPSLAHYLVTPFNRRFQQEVVTRKMLNAVQNSALSFVPQSTANDLTLTAALAVHERAPKYGFQIVGLIHDAIIGRGPTKNAEEFANMVKTEMEGAAAAVFHRVPFVAEATFGRNWAVL